MKHLLRPILFAAACVPWLVACGGSGSDSGASCTAANHCVIDENGNPTCAEGYERLPSSDPDNIVCVSTCGNDTCDANETPSSCPDDCGTCGNTVCEAGETPSNCPGDCGTCGNGVCDGGESSTNCPADCPAAVCDATGEYGLSCSGDTLHACQSGAEVDVYCPQYCLDQAYEGYRACALDPTTSDPVCQCFDAAVGAFQCEIDTAPDPIVREAYCSVDTVGIYVCLSAAEATTDVNVLWYYDCEQLCLDAGKGYTSTTGCEAAAAVGTIAQATCKCQ